MIENSKFEGKIRIFMVFAESVEEKRRAFTIFPISFLCYNRITMDKLIKTISESGSFRAYVLDSTETVRTAQEKHNTLSSTVALGVPFIANQILL